MFSAVGGSLFLSRRLPADTGQRTRHLALDDDRVEHRLGHFLFFRPQRRDRLEAQFQVVVRFALAFLEQQKVGTCVQGQGELLQRLGRRLCATGLVALYLLDMDARGVGQAQALQDNVLGYNARSQLTDITSSVPGADYRIHYDYDAFGNRKKVTTGFTNDIGDKKAIEVNYEYDAMDRMTKVSGNVNTTYHAPVYTSTYLPKEKPGMTYEDIAPDVIVTWTSFDNKPIEAHTITYDWAGNRAIDNGETYGYDALGRLSTISTSAGQTGYRYYDSASRVIESRDGADVQLNDYDAGGRLVVQRMQGQSDRVQRSLVKYNYHNELGYLASYTAQGASGAKLQTTTNTVDVLRDTRLTSLTKVQNDGETAYKTSEMQYNLAGAMTAVTARNYKDGVATVDNANSRSMIGDYAGHVLEKTQNGLRTHTLMADDEMIGYSSAAYESFSSVHEGLSAASNADVGVYVVQSATDTLTSIAKSVWGDERL